ncbi:response regulator transcription factor [Metabacillus sp. Hm71]|uniref:response regulator transcription factor n=1 Tax=Metabacillus sp. Hm71 TaxID=3450743 RepID=UPI003F435441
MKAIIIDDENHVRDGIKLLGEWERLGIHEIFEAKDGEEAKIMIKEQRPEIIFTDMNMPKLDGTSLLKWLHESKITSKIIVVSGYDDFHYMRNAITYGSFDYILKPIEPEILNETLERAIKDWKKQALMRESTLENTKVMNEIKPLYWDHLFTGMINKPTIPSEARERVQKEFGIDITKENFTTVLGSIHPIISKSFAGDRDLAFFTILNICNEIVWSNRSGVSFRNVNKEDEIVIVLWKQTDQQGLLQKIQTCILTCCQMNVIFAVGHSSQQLHGSYQSAQQTMLKHDLLSAAKKRIVSYEEIRSSSLLHLLDYTQEIMWALQSGSIEQMDQVLNKIFTTLQTAHIISLEQIQAWENQFDLLRKNWLKEYQINEDISFYHSKDYWEEDGSFSFEKFKDEKRKEFHELIHFLFRVKYQKEKNSIQEIEAYIRNNYERDITLQEIADRFYLSREYISRRFKSEYNETITNYLTTIRIEKAKELLENPHLKIYEISFKVGYQNEKYFSKVFKKIVGLTPNEYRVSVMSK